MKKTVLPFIAVGAMSVSSHAFSQSSVTLYGVIDESVQYTHNNAGASNSIGLQSGQMSLSQWGLKGREDLGGGLAAIFDLQNQFDVNNGTMADGLGFGRQAYVGLERKDLGTFTLGRQYDGLIDLVIPVQGNYFLEYFTAPGDVDLGDGSAKVSNAIKWLSPVWGGVQAALQYSFGNVAGSTGLGQSYSAALNYSAGPLTLAGGYLHADNGSRSGSARGDSSVTGMFFSPVNAAYSTASKYNIARAGAAYVIGPVTVGGYYSHSEYLADTASTFRTAERYNNGSVFALWQVTALTQLEFGYDYMKSHGDSSATYQQATIAADYQLSKRTDLYASASYGRASGNNGEGVAQAVIADSYINSGKASQEVAMVGIRHRF
jgi:predicted porin